MTERQEPSAAPAPSPAPRASARPRQRRRRALGCLLRAPVYLTLLLATGFVILVGWLGGERGGEVLARFVATRVGDALGGARVEVGRVRWDLWPLSLEAENVVVAGREEGQPPLAELPLVRVDLTIEGGTITIDQLYLREPRVYLQLDQGGATNLPRFSPSTSSRERRVRLAALVVERGSFRFNATEYPLDFAARDVAGRLSETGDGAAPRLEGTFTLGELLVGLPKARPYPVALSAKLRIEPRRLEVIRAELHSPELRATGQGSVNYGPENRRSSFTFRATGDAAVLVKLGYVPAPETGVAPLVVGSFRFAGRTEWQPGQSLVTGTLEADRLELAGRVFEEIKGPLTIDPEQVFYQFTEAGYAGGRVTGAVTVLVRPPEHPVEVRVELAEVDLRRLAADQGLELPEPVSGRVAGTASYRFQSGSPLAGDGKADLALAAVPGSPLPLAGPAALTFEAGTLVATAARFATATEDHVVTGDGRFELAARAGRFRWQVRTGNVGTLARAVLPPFASDPAWLPTAGVGTLAGELAIAPDQVGTSLQLDLVEVVAPGGLADRLTGSFSVSEKGIDDLTLELEQGIGRLGLSGAMPFTDAPLSLALDARGWPLDGRSAAWIPLELGLEGTATGRLALTGTADQLAGNGRLAVASARAAGWELGSVDCDFGFGSERIELHSCAADTPAGRVVVTGTSLAGAVDLTLAAPRLDLAREPLFGLTAGTADGIATLSAHFQGSFERPRLMATATVVGLAINGRRLGSGVDQEPPSRVDFDWDGEQLKAEIGLADTAMLRGGGAFTLDRAALRFDFDVPAQTLPLPPEVPPVTVALGGELTLEGSPRRPAELVLTLEADQVHLRQGERELINREPARARLVGTSLAIETLFLGEPGHDDFLFLTGRMELAGNKALDLKLQATMATNWLQPWLGTTRVEGTIDALAALAGTLDAPRLSGQGELLSATVRFPNAEFPPRLDAVGAVLYFDPKQVKLDSLSARIGGGRLTASGGIDLAALPQVEYLFEGTFEDVDLRYPEGFVFRGDADVLLESTPEGRRIRGVARLERAYYLDDVKLGLIDLVRTALQGSRQVEATTDPWLGATALALSVRAPGTVRVTNNLADLRGTAELQVRGSLARPLVLGTVDLDPGGFLVQDANRFELERGQLTWNGPVLDPVVDLSATARIKSYEVTLALSGQASRLRLELTSDPPLPDLEVFSLLAGVAPDEAQRTAVGTESGAEAARRILVGQLGAALGQRVGTLFGLDRVSINPDESQDSGSLGSVGVTLGKRLSKDIFVTYTQRPPGSSREREMKLEWQVTPNLTLVLVGVQDEAQGLTYSIDALWLTRF